MLSCIDRLHHCQRGQAGIELLFALPVLVVMLILLAQSAGGMMQKFSLVVEARNVAWNQGVNGTCVAPKRQLDLLAWFNPLVQPECHVSDQQQAAFQGDHQAYWRQLDNAAGSTITADIRDVAQPAFITGVSRDYFMPWRDRAVLGLVVIEMEEQHSLGDLMLWSYDDDSRLEAGYDPELARRIAGYAGLHMFPNVFPRR